jgi:hypothetical protein
MWDKAPYVKVMLNNRVYWKGDITGTSEKPDVIEFEETLHEKFNYELRFKRLNKDDSQTIVNDKGDILHDQLLHIKSIEIDEIDIGNLVFEGTYTPEYPKPWYEQEIKAGRTPVESYKNVTAMGHNGDWKWTFSSPFYMWLLENLY